jgi:serine/threonine protein kinase
VRLSRGAVPLVVAAKTTRSSDIAAREQLLHEAALVALLEHRNIVGIVGVVTMPQNMPPMLVLEYCEYGTLLEEVSDPDNFLNTSMLLSYVRTLSLHGLASAHLMPCSDRQFC